MVGRRRRGFALTVLAVLATACTGDADGPAPSPTAVAMVVDTDLAVDDLVALAFLTSSNAVALKAVTVSGTGEVRCSRGLSVIRALLTATRTENVPIACGRSTPLAGDHEFPKAWRDAADAGWGLPLAPEGASAPEQTAVDLLTDSLAAGSVTVLTLGPLTNIAEVLRAHPDLAQHMSSIVVMGGALDVAGNVTDPALDAAASEWNLYVDPTAAAEVIASGVPVTLVGLDATDQVPVTPAFVERLATHTRTFAAALVQSLYEQNPFVASGDTYFWDPLAAAAIVEPRLLATAQMRITVITGAGPDSGRTVRSADGSLVQVAIGVDASAFERLLIATLDPSAPDPAD